MHKEVERIERKYMIRDSSFLKNYLEFSLLPDKEYPLNYVFTLSFDTDDLEAYFEKLNGDLYRKKLRVRWYSDTVELCVPTHAYIENKVKYNNVVVKHRKRISLPRGIRTDVFNTADWSAIIEEYKPYIQFRASRLLNPIMISSYKRQRFYDVFSQVRVCVDEDIRTQRINFGAINPSNNSAVLNDKVLEVKSDHGLLPIVLRNPAFVKLARFSKYERLLTRLMG
jgi:hypothetical protein